jgi:hypothetical protein
MLDGNRATAIRVAFISPVGCIRCSPLCWHGIIEPNDNTLCPSEAGNTMALVKTLGELGFRCGRAVAKAHARGLLSRGRGQGMLPTSRQA